MVVDEGDEDEEGGGEGGGGPEDEAGVADGEQAGDGGGAADLADADGGAPGGHHDGAVLFGGQGRGLSFWQCGSRCFKTRFVSLSLKQYIF